MNKKILLILPLIALGLSGCKGSNKTSYDDDEEISFPPGTVPEEPSGSGSSGYGSDGITSTSDGDLTVTGILSIEAYPESFDIDEGIDLTQVTLKLGLSNNGYILRHPESLDYDASPAQIGQLIPVTAIYGAFSTTFNSMVTTAPHDLINVAFAGTTSSTYKDWTKPSTIGDAVYVGRTGGATDMTFSGSNKDTGFVSSFSGGRIKKIKIEWCENEPQVSESSKPKLGIFLQTTPFLSNRDLLDFTASDAAMQLQWQENTFVYEPAADVNNYYVGFRALNGTPNITSIAIYWDSTATVPTLESMAFTSDSQAFAETDYTEWDLSKVKVQGTFTDETTVDITRFVELSSSTPIPSQAYVSYDVTVTANYTRESKSHTDTVRGVVDAAMVTSASFVAPSTVTGGALTHSCESGTDTAGIAFLADKEANPAVNYLQILSDSPYWTTSPSQITIQAVIGGGSNKTFSSGCEVKVVLLAQDGSEIAGTEKVLATQIVKEGSELSVDMNATDNVYGVKIKHVREGTHKCRYYSFALRYIA